MDRQQQFDLNRAIHADVLDGLTQLLAGMFHCVVTSPPYWQLRRYPGVDPTSWSDGQYACLGAEGDPDSFVRHLVEVFAGVRRVLRDDGVLFVNLGETYATGGGKAKKPGGGKQGESWTGPTSQGNRMAIDGLQEGDRCGVPERFALAMQADGWVWRDTIQWVKRSPMPMSRTGWRWMRCRVKAAKSDRADNPAREGDLVRQSAAVASRAKREAWEQEKKKMWLPCPGCDKCRPNDGWVLRKGRFCTTAACEPIFMFTNGRSYFCDSEAASVPSTQHPADWRDGRPKRKNHVRGEFGGKNVDPGKEPFRKISPTSLPRSYFLLSNEPKREKHFAAYPSEIPRRLIEMATSKAGCCPTCGTCYAPVVESGDLCGNRDPGRHVANTTVLGYRQSCGCPPADPVPCRVLDPFAGTGTTLRVAHHLGRDYVGIEASADYLPIIEANVKRPLPTRKEKSNGGRKTVKSMQSQRELFA